MDTSRYRLSSSYIVSQEDKEGSDSSVTVAVRVRPFSQRELADKSVRRVVSMCGNETTVTSDDGTVHQFAYDFSFWSFDLKNGDFAGQDLVYRTLAEPLLSQAFEGYNTCLFAYGQTGSGKSYSIMGQENENEVGIIPRLCKDLFFRAQPARDINQVKIKLEVSSFEIYNEQIYDLLSSSKEKNGKKCMLNVREHPVLGPYVEDLSTVVVESFEDMDGWITLGNKNRATSATQMNDKSSRSHLVFTIFLTQTKTKVWEGHEHDHLITSKINLVDLAGSERQSQTMTSGERLREGANINKSLLTLGKVISLLSEHSAQNGRKKKTHIPYRDSVLTWLLKESLGGNSKTAMIATISPANSHIEETLSTLRYAKQAGSVVNVARVNENPKDKLIQELRAEIEHLRLQTGNVNSEEAQTGTHAEIICLHDQLKAREKEMEEMTRSWQEQLKIEESRLLEIAKLKHQIERYEEQNVEYNILQQQIKHLKKEHSDLRFECTLLKIKICDLEKAEQDEKGEIVEQLNNEMTHEKDDLGKPHSLLDETRSKLEESEMTLKQGQCDLEATELKEKTIFMLQTLRCETKEDTLKMFMEKEQTWEQKEQEFIESIRTKEDTLKMFMEKEQTWEQKEQEFIESIRTKEDTLKMFMEKEQTWEQKEQEFIESIRTKEDTLKMFMEKEQTWEQKEQELIELIKILEYTLKVFIQNEQTWENKEQEIIESIRTKEDTLKMFMEKEQTWEQKKQEFIESIRTKEDTLKMFMEKEQTWEQKKQEFIESIRTKEDTLMMFMEKEQTWEQKEQEFIESVRTKEDTLKMFMEKEQTWEQKEQELIELIRILEYTLKVFIQNEQTWENKEQEIIESIRTKEDTLKMFMEKEQTWKQKEQEFIESIRTKEDTLKMFMEKEQTWEQKEQEFIESIRDLEDWIQMLREYIRSLHHGTKEKQIKEVENEKSSELLPIAKWSQNSTFFQQNQPAVQQSSWFTFAKWSQSLTLFQKNQPAVQQTSSSLSPVTSDVQTKPQPKGPEADDFRSLRSSFQAEDISYKEGAKCLQALYRKMHSQ